MKIPVRDSAEPSLEWMVWMYQTRQIRYREAPKLTLRERCHEAAVRACGVPWMAVLFLWWEETYMKHERTARGQAEGA